MDGVEEPKRVVMPALWNAREGHTIRKHRARRDVLHGLRPRRTWLSVHSRMATPKTRRHRIISCSRAVLAGVLLHMFSGVDRCNRPLGQRH